MSLEQDNKMVANTWAACQTLDLRHQLGEVKAPSLVITGMNNLFIPPYLVRALADRLPDVELEIWEETGHFPFLEDPVRFNRRIEAFITCCLARSGETP
jgi:pimeloyl-ACP methyl ester carboxylesterase